MLAAECGVHGFCPRELWAWNAPFYYIRVQVLQSIHLHPVQVHLFDFQGPYSFSLANNDHV